MRPRKEFFTIFANGKPICIYREGEGFDFGRGMADMDQRANINEFMIAMGVFRHEYERIISDKLELSKKSSFSG